MDECARNNYGATLFKTLVLYNNVSSYAFSVTQGSCLPGWYKIDKFCFLLVPFLGNDISNGYKTLNTARKKWLEAGADLATPHKQSILKSLRSVYQGQSWHIPGAYLRPLLLGAYDSLHVEWKWSDGSRVNAAVWGPGEPKMTKIGKCGVMANLAKDRTSRTWCGWWLEATYCDQLRGFICETLPGSKTNNIFSRFSVTFLKLRNNSQRSSNEPFNIL